MVSKYLYCTLCTLFKYPYSNLSWQCYGKYIEEDVQNHSNSYGTNTDFSNSYKDLLEMANKFCRINKMEKSTKECMNTNRNENNLNFSALLLYWSSLSLWLPQFLGYAALLVLTIPATSSTYKYSWVFKTESGLTRWNGGIMGWTAPNRMTRRNNKEGVGQRNE